MRKSLLTLLAVVLSMMMACSDKDSGEEVVGERPCSELCSPFQWAEVFGECRCSNQYFTMKRAQELHDELAPWDARLINNGVRNPNKARETCGDAVLPYNGFSSWDEITPVIDGAFAVKVALFGEDGQSGVYSKLLLPNRHFGEGRSTVYKPEAEPWLREARFLLNGTGTESAPNGPVSRLDGIWGKCQEMQKSGNIFSKLGKGIVKGVKKVIP